MTKSGMHKKLNKKGFTLVESLVALAILVFFGAIVTIGINAALNTYQQMTFETNCRILEDNINTAFGGLVRSSTYIKKSSDNLYFKSNQYSATYGFGKMGLTSNGQIYLYAEDTRNKDYADCPLVSPGSYDNMKLKNVKVTCKNESNNALLVLTYTISSSSGDKQKTYECKYRTINTNKVEGINSAETQFNIT